MSLESLLRTDLLDPDLLIEPEKIRVIAQQQFDFITTSAVDATRTKSQGVAKDIDDVADLIYQSIQDYETRTHTSEDAKLKIVYEFPDKEMETETVSICFAHRIPGSYSQGAPGEGKIKNRRPILRETMKDPENPGYRRAIMGYYYDNVIRLIAWAKTNKTANKRAIWLENVIEEYTWFLSLNGVNRILFEGWGKNEVIDLNSNRYFGRPLDFFVRTEKVFSVNEKELEEICIRLMVARS